jgi:TolB-like protein
MRTILKFFSLLIAVFFCFAPNFAYGAAKETKTENKKTAEVKSSASPDQKVNQGNITPEQKVKEEVNKLVKPIVLRIALPNFTILDKSLEKSNVSQGLVSSIRENLKKNTAFSFVDLKKAYPVSALLTSDDIISIGKENVVDLILTGSITKLGSDLLVNVRLAETVIGKIIFSRQYFAKQNEINKISTNIIADLNSFAANLANYPLNIFDLGTGTAEVKVRSTPSNAKVAFDEKEMGRTPLMLKNVSGAQHLIETWREEDAVIRDLNISATDEKLYELKFNNKTYVEAAIKLTNLEQDEYSFEVISKPEDSSKGQKERPKLSDIKYDNRKFKLEIITEPDNIPVDLDGKSAGASPVTINDLTQGKHKIKLNRKKLLVFRQIVDTSANPISEVNFNMFKLGRVLISSTPSNADILLNNEKIGETPKSVELPLGKHIIEVKREGFKGEEYVLNVEEGKTQEINLNLTSLRNVDTNVSFLPTAAVDNNLGISAFFLSLGQYSQNENSKGLVYLYGTEANYGFKNLWKIGEYINLGVQFGAFYNKLAAFTLNKDFPSNQGVAAKVQFLSQGETIPVSAAIGAFYNFNSAVDHKLNLYLAASRDFGFLSVHLGVQMQPFKLSALNLNVNYNRFYRIKIGAAVLIDFSLLTNTPEEYITPLFGLTFGYNFF